MCGSLGPLIAQSLIEPILRDVQYDLFLKIHYGLKRSERELEKEKDISKNNSEEEKRIYQDRKGLQMRRIFDCKKCKEL